MNDEKINEIGQKLEVNYSDINKKSFIYNINPWYWIGQLGVFIASLCYSLLVRYSKQTATYPFDSVMATISLSPLPLSLHAANGYFSLTQKERYGLSRRFRVLMFCTILFVSICSFVALYLAFPVSYQSSLKYGVFNQEKN